MKPIRLRTRLSLTYLLISLFVVVLVSFSANYLLTNQFRAYAISKQNQRIDGIVDLLSSRYKDWNNHWDINGLESIGVNNLSEGLLLRIHDGTGQTIWDAQIHNSGMCNAILANIAELMQEHNRHFQGSYVEVSRTIDIDGNPVGSVDIGYYGPYFFTTVDLAFLNTLNKLLLTTGLLAMLASIGLGVFMAAQLARPINRVIEVTKSIAGGRYENRIKELSRTGEIVDLTNAVNSLADTLGQQENLRRQLVSDVAHELRTPLTILQSHLEAMIDGAWPADEEHLEGLHGETVRISGLVDDLSKLTQLEKGNLVLKLIRINLADLLRQIITHIRPDFDNRSIGLRLEADNVWIVADPDKLSQVFINLLTNALKYTPPGGEVVVQITSKKESVEVSVRDTGIGISSDDLPHIFERFYRTDKSRTRATGGTGIGLTIAKSIVEAHLGRIIVRSEPDKGSEFIVHLPLTLEPDVID